MVLRWERVLGLAGLLFLVACGDVVAQAVEEEPDSSIPFDSSDTGFPSGSDSLGGGTDSQTGEPPVCLGAIFQEEGDLVFDAVDSGGWITTGWKIWRNGYLEGSHDYGGETLVEVVAFGEPSVDVWPHMVVSVDGVAVGDETVTTTGWTTYSYAITARSGPGTVRVAMDNDANSETGDVNLNIQSISLVCP